MIEVLRVTIRRVVFYPLIMITILLAFPLLWTVSKNQSEVWEFYEDMSCSLWRGV